jgi:hypothetical protein
MMRRTSTAWPYSLGFWDMNGIREPTDIYLTSLGGGKLKGPAAKLLQKGHLIK